jgi:hypothetical protein
LQQHLDDTAKRIASRAHAVMLLDNAGWHRTKKLKWPKNMSHVHPSSSYALSTQCALWRQLPPRHGGLSPRCAIAAANDR